MKKNKIAFQSLFLLGLCLFILIKTSYSSGNQDDYEWKAGVSRINITPEKFIMMGGYAFRDHPANGKIMDLWAKALALQDAKGNKVLIVTMDLVSIPKALSDSIRLHLREKIGLTNSNIILNVSHTHTGPLIVSDISGDNDKDLTEMQLEQVNYARNLVKKVISVAVNAFGDMKPAHLYSGNGISRFQVNRHSNPEENLMSTTQLVGPNDYAVPVIKVVDRSNKVFALLFGYACHNTTLRVYKYSGDYAGFAQYELENQFPGSIALFFQGAGGNQNPLPRNKDPFSTNYGLAKKYGKDLAAAVEYVVYDKMKPLKSEISTTYDEIELPFEKAPPTKEELIKIINDSTSQNAYPYYLRNRASQYLKTLEKGGTILSSYPWYPVSVWNLGGQAIFAFGGELTIGYAIDLKRIFGHDIFVMGYSNNVMSYIPTAKMLMEGGYEVRMSPVFTTPYSTLIEYTIINQAVLGAKKVDILPKSSLPVSNSNIGEY